jgi:hypothetical protein
MACPLYIFLHLNNSLNYINTKHESQPFVILKSVRLRHSNKLHFVLLGGRRGEEKMERSFVKKIDKKRKTLLVCRCKDGKLILSTSLVSTCSFSP